MSAGLVLTLAAAGFPLPTYPLAAQAAEPGGQERTMTRNESSNQGGPARAGASGLPYAEADRVFASFEEYLEHRAYVATIGAPTLREIAPGRYVEEFRGGKKLYHTREELLKRLGFAD